MERKIFKAYAKLNLNIHLLPERGNTGYFNVQFVNTQISLFDTIELSRLKQNIININEGDIKKEQNIAFRAARLLFERYHVPGGVQIDITKRIPLRSGLGSGSTDAAAVINGLIELFGLKVERDEKVSLARILGMDVCYCIVGGLCRISGIGDIIEGLPYRMPVLDILIATPPLKKPSTAWAYSLLDERKIGKGIKNFEELMEGIRNQDGVKIANHLHNDFEKPVQREFPIVGDIKKIMIRYGAINTLLAGSGLSVFGIFENVRDLSKAKLELEDHGCQCFICQTIDKG